MIFLIFKLAIIKKHNIIDIKAFINGFHLMFD